MKKQIKDLDAYEIVREEDLPDLQSQGILLRHVKTGARIALVSNDDDNKVFCIGFRTTPTDSTGVPHIMEHSVLCGSEHFPVKDPFVELVKGSLNTFLNAMTYPDKTVYPVASCNDKDFQNLMHVYLDAVFYPNIYREPRIFMQEGWHYETDPDGSLVYNGVVYNEMKGAFSSPDELLDTEICKALYPDTTYAMVSGGDPACIPTLTYEQFIHFHRTYYSPTNAYIYLYGDMDMAEKLEFIDEEYLSKFDRADVHSEITGQDPGRCVARIEKAFPIGEEQDERTSAYLSVNYSVGDAMDEQLDVAMGVIEYALGAPGAPLKQALTDAGLGDEIIINYTDGIKEPYMSIVAKNGDAHREQEFLDIVDRTLREVVKSGFDKKAILAGINYYEFRYREADFGRFPKGLMYGLEMYGTWLYDDNEPFMTLHQNEMYRKLRELAATDYFEQLVRTYLIDNAHRSIVTLVPDKGLAAREAAACAEKLAQYRKGLTPDEVEEISKRADDLKAFQAAPDAPEDLAKIPMLAVSDVRKEANLPVNALLENCSHNILMHDIFTNGIAYIKLEFAVEDVPERLYPYIPILRDVLTQLDTEARSYADLTNEIHIQTGGVAIAVRIFQGADNPNRVKMTFEISCKVLEDHIPEAMALMEEIALTTKFDDSKRLYDVLAEAKSALATSLADAGHITAAHRALSHVSDAGGVVEDIVGIDYLRALETICSKYTEQSFELIRHLKDLVRALFTTENLLIDITGSPAMKDAVLREIPALDSKLYEPLGTYEDTVGYRSYEAKYPPDREAYKTPGQVQYVARAGNFLAKNVRYTGALLALQVMLGYDYLWNNVRVQGGAYGCMCSFNRAGDCYFVSYRDPNLTNTIDVFEKAAAYIESYQADDRSITQFVLGAIGELDMPMTPSAKGSYSLVQYMKGVTNRELQQERDELLALTPETLRDCAKQVAAFMSDEVLCVVGGAGPIEAAGELFGKVENLVTC